MCSQGCCNGTGWLKTTNLFLAQFWRLRCSKSVLSRLRAPEENLLHSLCVLPATLGIPWFFVVVFFFHYVTCQFIEELVMLKVNPTHLITFHDVK